MPTLFPDPRPEDVVLRRARADDASALVRLAALASARPLAGPALVAEENGTIVAALCLSTGRAVSDPFVRSLHLVELLRCARRVGKRLPSRHAAAGCSPASRSGGLSADGG
jgi:hypothetical protein